MDLFALARENGPKLREDFDQVKACLPRDGAEQLDTFVEFVLRHGAVSMNMRSTGLLEFLNAGRHWNAYELVAEHAARTGKPVDELLRAFLGVHYERRLEFARTFDGADRFRYGALNCGGLGATQFHEFCIVLSREFLSPVSEAAYITCDSLSDKFWRGSALDLDKFAACIAPDSHRGVLAALKHREDVSATPEALWPRMMCSEVCFTEVIFAKNVTPDAVEVIRVEAAVRDRYYELYWNEFSRGLKDGERCVVAVWKMIGDACDRHGIPLEGV